LASVAGVHSVLAGSRDLGRADRGAAGELLRAVPSAVTAVYQNRRFADSAVQFLTACAGVRQFIDLGCGMPAPGAVHEVALGIAPGARVAYLDHDPDVITELEAALAGYPMVLAMLGDVRRPDSILRHPALVSLIDLAEPVAVILTAVLHFVADADDPVGIVAAFVRAMAPGSYLVLSHAAREHVASATVGNARAIYRTAAASFVPRGQAEVTRLFGGLEVMAPGVVSGATWRPGYLATDPRRATFYAGLGRKR
jgi:SAM-dependent methyltransferase